MQYFFYTVMCDNDKLLQLKDIVSITRKCDNDLAYNITELKIN